MATQKKATNYRQIIIVAALILAGASMLLPSLISNVGFLSNDKPAAPVNEPLIAAEGESAPALSDYSKPTIAGPEIAAPATEPQFIQEGQLTFVNIANGTDKKSIDIEIADSPLARQTGLMFRKSMKETQGMLFVFEKAEPQAFWMRNTHIPLDLIFVNDQKQIITIIENTEPFNERPLPSNGNAQYVVEVKAGFCKKHGIGVSDQIRWQ